MVYSAGWFQALCSTLAMNSTFVWWKLSARNTFSWFIQSPQRRCHFQAWSTAVIRYNFSHIAPQNAHLSWAGFLWLRISANQVEAPCEPVESAIS